MNEDKNKIELISYMNVMWKRKWFILLSTLIFTTAAFVISLFLPPKWEVDAIFDPSRSVKMTEDGKWQVQFFYEPRTLADLINQSTYNNDIATELNLDIRDIPRLTGEVLPNTTLVRISLKEKEVEKGKLILISLCNHLKRNLDSYANNKIKETDSQIKSKEVEKSILEAEINAFKNKLNIVNQRKQEIEKDMINIRKRTEEIENKRRSILNKKNRNQSDNLAILLYSNEIQQNSMNQSMLSEWFGNKIKEEENINLELYSKEREKFIIESELTELNELKKGVLYARITKEPTPSTSPVSPKKLFNILIAATLGFIVSIMLAFLLEYIEKQKVVSRK